MTVTEAPAKAVKVRAVEWEVPASPSGNVRVRRDGSYVRVTWTCGDTRQFSVEDVKQAIGHHDAVKGFSDVWVEHRDSHGSRYAGRVTDGEFYADTSAREGGSHVPWEALKQALRKAMQD